MWQSRVAVIAAVVVAWLASSRVEFATVSASALQPRAPAFGIWLVIFPLLAIVPAEDDVRATWTVSLALAAAWADVVRRLPDNRRAAAALLAASATVAWLGGVRARRATVSTRIAAGLYAGWLSVATLLASGVEDGLLAASAVVAALAVATRAPTASLAVAWASALQKTNPAWGSLAIALAGAATAGVA